MPVAIITGSGTHALPGFEDGEQVPVQTPFGTAPVTRGRYAGVEALHVSRHGPGHSALSNQVSHRANIWALNELGATSVIACTACGAVDPALELGSLVVFDDLHFISNRLADGSICTFFTEPDDPRRGHWILHGGPFSDELRSELVRAAAATGHPAWDGGVYGHVDGPRFNTPTEIAQLAACGVTAVSQTAGPETVLCGELELPYALIGFVTDYANEVKPGGADAGGEDDRADGHQHRDLRPRRARRAAADCLGAPPGRGHGLSLRPGMSAGAPAVLIMARAPRRGQVRLALEPILGADGAVALQAALIGQATGWARGVAPGRVHIAHDPPDAGPELRELVPDDVYTFPQNGDGIAGRLADAVGRVFAHGAGPLLIVWPDLPQLRAEHATAALDDLANNCDLVLGPAIDGGFYLIGIPRPLPELFALSEQAWRNADAMSIGVAAAREAGLEIGILRAERALHRPADVRAALADPLLPDGIRSLLEPRG